MSSKVFVSLSPLCSIEGPPTGRNDNVMILNSAGHHTRVLATCACQTQACQSEHFFLSRPGQCFSTQSHAVNRAWAHCASARIRMCATCPKMEQGVLKMSSKVEFNTLRKPWGGSQQTPGSPRMAPRWWQEGPKTLPSWPMMASSNFKQVWHLRVAGQMAPRLPT